MDGRRAGLGLPRALASEAGAVGPAAQPVVAGVAALLITAVAGLSAGVILVGREQHRTELQRRIAEEQRILATRKAEDLRRRDAVSRVHLAYREYLDDYVALADDLLKDCPPDLRAWEWDYVYRLGHSELKTWVASEPGPRRLVRGLLARRLADRVRDRPVGPARRRPNRRADCPRYPYRRDRPGCAGWPARSRPWPTRPTDARSRRHTDSPAGRRAPS